MRRVVACVVAIALAVLAAGCNFEQERKFYREGIGSDLAWSGLAQQTQFLEEYISFICEQAGFPTVVAINAVTCSTANLTPRGWGEFVQAGMNDIDRRCDAYLVWLDDKRRSRGPIIKQIADLTVATQAIMRLSGVGADPITMAGVAFGLAQDTFTNVTSRLLMEIDKSTVQTVVLTEQNDFRRTIVGQTINSRSSAIYALRSYLRICMPYTIETHINTTVQFIDQGGVGGNKLVDASTVGITTVRNVLPPPPPPPPSEKMNSAMSPIEKAITKTLATAIQKALGIAAPDGEFGTQDSTTRDQLRQFEAGYWRIATFDDDATKPPHVSRGIVEIDAELRGLRAFASAVPSCGPLQFKTNYEAGVWIRLATSGLIRPFFQAALDDLKKANKIPATTAAQTLSKDVKRTKCKVDPDIRAAITILKTAYGLPAPPDDITDALIQALRKGPSP